MHDPRPIGARPALRVRAWMVVLTVLLVSGCGGSAASSGDGGASARDGEAPAAAAPETDDATAGELADRPSRAARNAGRSFDALLAAYAPVSARVNFLVAAETLRAAADTTGVGADVEEERYGAVRLEVRRMQRILGRARPRVVGVSVPEIDQKRVQDLMLGAIDARTRALKQLEATLDARVDPDTPDAEVDRRTTVWRASWNQSLRMAREATTTMQESRARLGLDPAGEEAIR